MGRQGSDYCKRITGHHLGIIVPKWCPVCRYTLAPCDEVSYTIEKRLFLRRCLLCVRYSRRYSNVAKSRFSSVNFGLGPPFIRLASSAACNISNILLDLLHNLTRADKRGFFSSVKKKVLVHNRVMGEVLRRRSAKKRPFLPS